MKERKKLAKEVTIKIDGIVAEDFEDRHFLESFVKVVIVRNDELINKTEIDNSKTEKETESIEQFELTAEIKEPQNPSEE